VRGLQRDDGNLELLDKMQIRMELPDWRILPLARSCLQLGAALSDAASGLLFALEAQESRDELDALRAQAKKA